MLELLEYFDKQALMNAYVEYAEFQDANRTQFDFSTQTQETKNYDQTYSAFIGLFAGSLSLVISGVWSRVRSCWCG